MEATLVDVKFLGRKAGALGVVYEIKLSVEVPNPTTLDELRLMLYNKGYEHISLDKRDVFVTGSNERYFITNALV